MTNAGTATTKLVATAGVVTKDSAGNEINIWNDSTNLNVVTTAGTTGVSSEWVFDIIPDNAALADTADAHIKFKVNQNMPKGTTLKIKAPNNLTIISTGEIQDLCWSKIMYQTCEVNSSKIELVLDQDVTALS